MSDRPVRIITPILLIVIGVLFIAGALVTLYLPKDGNTAPTAASSEEIPFAEVERVNLDRAKAAFNAGDAVFLDVRSSEAYAANHIPGALSIPLEDLEARLGELDSGAWIIPY